jgi:hypothetical protein
MARAWDCRSLFLLSVVIAAGRAFALLIPTMRALITSNSLARTNLSLPFTWQYHVWILEATNRAFTG